MANWLLFLFYSRPHPVLGTAPPPLLTLVTMADFTSVDTTLETMNLNHCKSPM